MAEQRSFSTWPNPYPILVRSEMAAMVVVERMGKRKGQGKEGWSMYEKEDEVLVVVGK